MSNEYYNKLIPWGKKASTLTGLPFDFIVAQWSWETNFGTNRGAKSLNNHAGIKFSKYAPAGTVKDGMYSKYPSMEEFIKDYARVMNLSYYKGIKSARTDYDRVHQLNISPYSESDYNINTMLERQKIIRQLGGGISVPEEKLITSNPPTSTNNFSPNLSALSGGELEQWATVGLAFAFLLTLMPKSKNA